MGPIKAVAYCYARMLNFSGRARRAEYWWFFAWQVLLGIVVQIVAIAALRNNPEFMLAAQDRAALEAWMQSADPLQSINPLYGLAYFVFVTIPALSVTIRRLHDTDRSGWKIFMPLVVSILAAGFGGAGMALSGNSGSVGGMLGALALMLGGFVISSIWFLVWLCLPGSHGNNRFGGDPIANRKVKEPAHPAFASELHGEARDRSELARRTAARDYYKRRVLPSIQKA